VAVAGSGAADRSPVLVFAPNTRSTAKLPLVLLLHGRCDNALGADASFHFANLVDQARAAASTRAACARGCGARFRAATHLLGERIALDSQLTARPATVRFRARGARGHAQRQHVQRMQLRAAGRAHLPPVGGDACVLQEPVVG
jgi:hypothetical protein